MPEEWFYIIPAEETVEKKKKGPGRGWWGPPKGTHGPGSQGGGKMRTQIKRGLAEGKKVTIKTDVGETHTALDMRRNVIVTNRGHVHISHVVSVRVG